MTDNDGPHFDAHVRATNGLLAILAALVGLVILCVSLAGVA